MSRDDDLAGTVSLVTGAAGGIGSATVRTLVELGSTVVAADLPGTDFGPLRDLVSVPELLDTREVDISAEDSVVALLGAVRSAHGRLDVLDNNAGVTNKAAFDFDVVNMDVAMWDEIQACAPALSQLLGQPVTEVAAGGNLLRLEFFGAVAGGNMFFAGLHLTRRS